MSVDLEPGDDGDSLEIAIVGMAGRFPGADTVDAFWRRLRDGVESVTRFTDDELRARGVPDELLADPAYVKAGVLLDGMDRFDAEFFGYAPREAERIDPQQRLFLECAWHALEHAGQDPRGVPGPVGVFGGEGANLYLLRHLLPSAELGAGGNIADLLSLLGGNGAGSLATRVAYKLNLRGPAMTVQTACSTSLTAVHLACQSLLAFDCDLALAGGVWLNLLQGQGYRYQAGAILSPDGHCRAFDARAGGTLVGSGAGVVVLKRLADALRDGDTVHAVIKGSAANNDGAAKVGFTAPSIDGQASAICTAHRLAGVQAGSIGYVEAHGTGTTLGDPIEIAALTQAFGSTGALPSVSCALGSVKTNIGHLDAAAGVAGLIKTVLALQHRTLPPSLHFESPNPQIDFAAGPFHVNTAARPWPAGATPRRAGVSSFGIGGTNVHVVLEEAPPVAVAAAPLPWCVLPLSARTPQALQQLQSQLAGHLESHPELNLADVAHTLQSGRSAFPYRSALVVSDLPMAVQALRDAAQEPATTPCPDVSPEVCFLFPGAGSQHAHMSAALYASDADFRSDVDDCCEHLLVHEQLDLRPLLLPADDGTAAAQARLERIEFAQPAMFVIEYALARLWMRRGVRPAMMLGHSLGEYAAACIAGVFLLPDALRVVAARGRLLASLPSGAMTAVSLSEAELLAQLPTGCDLAGVNAPGVCVLAGPMAAMQAAEAALLHAQPRRLHVSIASHSAMTEPLMAAMAQVVAGVERQAPTLPFISNVTGQPITADDAVSPSYWARHLRSPVRFGPGVQHWLSVPGRVLLETGPGEALTGLARQQPLAAQAAGMWPSQAHPQQHARNAQQLARAMAGLWCAGVLVKWAACPESQGRRRVPLPGYPFQRERYWIEAPKAGAALAAPRGVADWFYAPSWVRDEPRTPVATTPSEGCVLVLADGGPLSAALLRHLQQAGRTAVTVKAGLAYARTAERRYTTRPGDRDDHVRLLREATAEAGPVRAVFHLWSLGDADDAARLELGFHALLAVSQALAGSEAPITVVTDGVADVLGDEPLAPAKAALLGACTVIGQEHPGLACRVVDVHGQAEHVDACAAALLTEHAWPAPHGVVAYRSMQRWLRRYEPVRRDAPTQSRLREGGVYLVTGGLGGVGLVAARHLARKYGARLALMSRAALPPREHWQPLADAPDTPPVLRERLRSLLELSALGAEVLLLQADVADAAAMRQAVAQVQAHWGVLHGVIHAAGLPGGGLIAARQRADVEAVFAPKLEGARHVLDAVRPLAPDFVLLCSSLTAIVGAFGQSDYAAANACLDALALEATRQGGPWVLSVNWDTWREVGLGAGQTLDDALGIRPAQGVEVLERLLAGPAVPQAVVSTIPLAEQVANAQSTRFAERLLAADAVPRAATALRRRPVLATPYAEPATPLEADLAASWEQFLGISPIGVADNLFELGGDSLIAIQLIARLRKTYGVEVHPADFFKTPTVVDLATLIEIRLIEQIEQVGPSAQAAAAALP